MCINSKNVLPGEIILNPLLECCNTKVVLLLLGHHRSTHPSLSN
jgi:hypothetical protein